MRKIFLLTAMLTICYVTLATAGNSSKNFGGVGIDGVPWADGRIVVKQVVAGGPAHLAGIKPGDIITHIDGKKTVGSDFKQMVNRRLRGISGTDVQINIIRPGETKPRVFVLKRKQLIIK